MLRCVPVNLFWRSAFFLLLSLPAMSQTASLRGVVADQSGAVIPGATVNLYPQSGAPKSAETSSDGGYLFRDLVPGKYTVRVTAPGMVLRQTPAINIAAGAQTLNLQMGIAEGKQEVTVEESVAPATNVDPTANASAVVLRGADLDALSDNPDDLAADLAALAGPAAGPNGSAIFIDGFSGGQLPPKESIREIRINSNPFSPEYDRLGLGRIEIFTKPGSDKYRGSLGYNFAHDKLNSRNAYAAEKAPFQLHEFSGTLSGPINKRASFNFNAVREWVDNGNVINGVTLDAQGQAVPSNGTFVSTLSRVIVTPRVDFQINANNTLSARYSYNRDDVENAGVGALNLVSRGYRYQNPSQTVQLTETAVIGTSIINETRFQYFRPSDIGQANSAGFALQVLGAFNGGGNPIGRSSTNQNIYEVQNYTSVLKRAHAMRFGVRLRGALETSNSPQNFNGTFTFSGGLAPQLNAANQAVLDGAGLPVLLNISSIESYRRTLLFQQLGLPAAQIRQLGGGASQFSINAGNPTISGGQVDLGAFFGDDWRLKPNMTLSLGLRYETQSNIHDWRDWAPRIGLAWAPGGANAKVKPKTVLRGGFGMFYDRFSLANTLLAQRYNGVVQQQIIVANPNFFPNVPAASSLSGSSAPGNIQQISSTLRAPYLMQSALSVERQLPFGSTIAVTYANTHGLHLLRSSDTNSPIGGVYPLGRPGLAALIQSAGLYNQNQWIVNVNSKVNKNISLVSSYVYNRARSNTDGLNTFPANPYSMAGEYGPASTDIRHRVSLSGTITTFWGIRLNPLLTGNTGPPFDITAGRDLYGNSLFNGRPGIATSASKAGVVNTEYGLLDPSPTPGQQLLSRNYGRGPGQIMLNLRVGKTFTFGGSGEGNPAAAAPLGGAGAVGGGGGGGGNRNAAPGVFTAPSGQASGGGGKGRYALVISMQIRNITNHNNPGPIIGNITSPLFGQANQPAGAGGVFSESANNRRMELQTRFTF